MDFLSDPPPDPGMAQIPLENGPPALVDADLAPYLRQWSWRAVRHRKSLYAHRIDARTGETTPCRMHRLVCRPPRGCIIHHRNRNSLDNRRSNLVPMTRAAHKQEHFTTHCLVQYA